MTNYALPYDAFLRAVKQNADTDHVFLLGAGASISSGVKSADDCIWEWKKDIFVSKNPNLTNQYKEYKAEAVKASIQKWLDNEGCYPTLNDPEEYSKYALLANPIEAVRRKFFENICRDKEPYIGYKLLCLFAQFGMIRSVFTTNLDGLTVKAAYQTGVTPIEITLESSDRIFRPSSKNELLCVALHGDFKYGPTKNTAQELDAQHDTFADALSRHLQDKHLIVMGYSGRDRSLMDALKKAYSQKGAGLLFWCGYGDEIKPEVAELLAVARQAGRDAYFVSTDGFDNSMIHLSKNCFENNKEFKSKVEENLKSVPDQARVNTPFSMEVKHTSTVIRSNLFPLSYPKEVFQFELQYSAKESPWDTLNELTANTNVVAVPLKRMVYAFGTLSDIHSVFEKRLKSEICRTPVQADELRSGSVFKSLYRKTLIKSICQQYNLMTNGFDKIWLAQDIHKIRLNDVVHQVYETAKLSIFFDSKYAYISIKPSFEMVDPALGEEIKFEIGKYFYDILLKKQPNLNFDSFLSKWKRTLFPDQQRLQLEYPKDSGSGFKFGISNDTIHVNIMRANNDFKVNYPKSFNQKTIVHGGIQYLEPQMEFINKDNGRITKDFHPMRGLINNQPYDYLMNGNVFEKEINLGIICPLSYGDKLFSFLNRINQAQSAGIFNPDYLLDFPGFLSVFGVPLNVPHAKSDRWQDCNLPDDGKDIKDTALKLLTSIKKGIDRLDNLGKNLVIVVFIPTFWNQVTTIDDGQEKFDLHDHIKAYAAQRGIATQFLQESTLGESLVCQVNWWLSLSFYVKALRTPWILTGLDPKTAFVGIGYSVNHRLEKDRVVLGCSHIYSANGQGLKYKLSRVDECQIDRQNNPFLSYNDAYKFGVFIREMFFSAMGELPTRVVVHKRTHFKKDEINGIVDSLKKSGIEQIDLVEICHEDDARFISLYLKEGAFQPHPFPLSRGTCFILKPHTALLWTHGIVPSVKSGNRNYYLGGKNIPVPLKVKKHYGDSNISTIATEILGLTKMNWNSFDLYSRLPATIETSNKIAKIGWLLNRFEGRTYDYRHFM